MTSANSFGMPFCDDADIHESTSEKKTSVDINALIRDINDCYTFLKKPAAYFLKSAKGKSDKYAVELRFIGNEKFRNAQHYESLILYTKSVAFALEGSEEIAIAYANRSAVLFRIGKYVLCLMDINRALEGKYPAKLRKKLCDRKKECLIQISRASNADKKPTYGDEVDPDELANPKTDVEWRKTCNFRNPLLPNASSKIKLECNDKWGRFMMATENIEPGEILSSQKFATLLLLSERQYENCSYCLLKCYALIPCRKCPQAMYCCKNCRTQAYNSYHRVECKMFSFQEMLDVDFLSLRTLLIGTEQGLQLKNLMEKLTARDIFAENIDPTNKPFVDDYLSVLRLSRTYGLVSLKMVLSRVLKMIIALQRVAFFESDPADRHNNVQQDNLNETELFATMLLMNHKVSSLWDSFCVNRVSSFVGFEKSVGSGICTLHNMINHSCNPNASFLTRSRESVLFANRPIKKGEQIFVNYCNSYDVTPKAERGMTLLFFGFACVCEACNNKWPLGNTLALRETKFLHKNKKELLGGLMEIIFSNSRKEITSLPNFEILQICIKYNNWLHTNAKAPSFSLEECKKFVVKFMLLLYDDFNKDNHQLAVQTKVQFDLALKAMLNEIFEL